VTSASTTSGRLRPAGGHGRSIAKPSRVVLVLRSSTGSTRQLVTQGIVETDMATYDQDKARDRAAELADERRHREIGLRRCIVCWAWTHSIDGWGFPQCQHHGEYADKRIREKGW
jgi:hypothetical protein